MQLMIISIVGNAKSIFNSLYGSLIDTAEIIIRFNRGVPIKPECQGTKTHILVFMNPAYKDAFHQNLTYWHTVNFPERTYLENVLGYPPSNGIVSLEKVKNDYPNAIVQIFGFDWKKTHSFWRPERPSTKHNYKKEEAYCKRLIKENKWKLYT